MLALLLALRRLQPGHEVFVFYHDASLPPCFTEMSSSPFFGPVTRAIDEYLCDTPSSSITGFWAHRSWTWPGKTPWWTPLIEAEFHSSLDTILKVAPSRHRMFLEWATDWVPLSREDFRRHRKAVADAPQRELHPFVLGVLKRGSRRLQCAAFQVATGHCFSADYSAAFREGAEDTTDCPDCGAFASHTHVLDTCPGLSDARVTWLHDHSSYTIFSSEDTGTCLVDFLFHTQRLLRPLDPVPADIPPEPDP
jgi:hypothetical protein